MKIAFVGRASVKPDPVPAAVAQWTRWGRGCREGYTFWVGDAVRGKVVCGGETPPTWSASCDRRELGRYPSRDAAMARVETEAGPLMSRNSVRRI